MSDQTITEALDNRPHLKIDPKQVESWEIAVIESPKVTDWLMLFARYLENGSGLVSPDLPDKPLNKLTLAERAVITNSAAYDIVQQFKIPALKNAIKTIQEQISAGF